MHFIAVPPPSGDFAKPCQICLSHKTNADGYLYKHWAEGGRKVREPFYRFILRAANNWTEWPEGYEANHKCGNRGCCEPSHIEPIGRSAHKSLTNTLRYADRIEEAHQHWLATGCTGTALAELFGVSASRACHWIREWKADPFAA